jgi:hypothetical protein
MDIPYKLHVKLGSSEFNGEGPENTVKEAYQQFLAAFNAYKGFNETQVENTVEKAAGVDDKVLERAYICDGEKLSLRHLPPADRPNKPADAAILILYGFKKLLHQDDVLVTKLNESLRTSGIGTGRLDRFMGVHNNLYRKGGTRSGGRYSLNNQGDLQAESWLREWFN